MWTALPTAVWTAQQMVEALHWAFDRSLHDPRSRWRLRRGLPTTDPGPRIAGSADCRSLAVAECIRGAVHRVAAPGMPRSRHHAQRASCASRAAMRPTTIGPGRASRSGKTRPTVGPFKVSRPAQSSPFLRSADCITATSGARQRETLRDEIFGRDRPSVAAVRRRAAYRRARTIQICAR